MPILDPRANNVPKGDPNWRYAYDEFRKLKALVNRHQISTAGWQIKFPKGFEKAKDNRWQIWLIWPGQESVSVHYIGHDGRSASQAIKAIRQIYQEHFDAGLHVVRPDPNPTKPKDPREDRAFIERAFFKWSEVMKGVRSNQDWEETKKKWPKLLGFMNLKAGIIDMTMSEYLTKHPLAQLYPTPPMNQKQYENMLAGLKKWTADNEKAAKDSPNFSPYTWYQNRMFH
jgi:hypothetical protein